MKSVNTEMRPVNSADLVYSVSSAVLTALIIFINVNNNFVLDFDSWAYWEGSLSILNGEGYYNIRGTRITAWPPLFSMLLALWQSVFGVSLFSIKMLFVSLGFCTALILSLIHKQLFTQKWILVLLFIIVVGYTNSVFYKLHSESLWILLSACLMFVLVFHSNILFNTALLVVFTCMLLCKNVSLALMPGLLIFVVCKHHFKLNRGLILSLACVILPVLIWQSVRLLLEQTGSHFAGLPSIEKITSVVISNYYSFSESLFVNRFHLGSFGALLTTVLMLRMLFIGKPASLTDMVLPHSVYIVLIVLYILCLSMILSLTDVPAGQIRFYIPVFMILVFCLATGNFVDSKFTMVYILSLMLIAATLTFRTLYFTTVSLKNMENWNTMPNSFQLSESWVNGVLDDIDGKLDAGQSVQQAMSGSWISYNTYLKWKGKPLISNVKKDEN